MLPISGTTPLFAVSFLISLMSQLSDPNYKTHLDYKLSPDFLYASGVTFKDGVEVPINSACEDGPDGEIPPMDFIIVGAGPAGSVLANKLATAFPKKTVLLIEAGGDGFASGVSPGTTLWNFQTDSNYKYHAEKSPEYGNMVEDGTIAYAGKGLGGGTAINGMYFSCGTTDDFNYWAEVSGDEAWNAENMFKNLKEFTNVQDEEINNDPECQKYLGTNGPLTVSFFNTSNPVDELPILMRAAESAGYDILKDINCGKWKGFVQFKGTIKNGERNSATRVFLAPMRNHRNLMIMRNTFVEKIIMKDGEVVGVKVHTNRPECSEFEIHANQEVIISAGTFDSPGILLRSGIGRKEDLNEINVTQILDLAVGHNYKDHFQTWHYLAVPAGSQLPQTSNPEEDYLLRRQGSMSHISSEDTHAFFNLNGDGPYPDLAWDVFHTKAGQYSIEMQKFFANIRDEYFKVLLPWSVDHDLLNVGNVILQPKSTGQVTTKNNRPVIHGRYASDPDDVRILIQGIRKLHEFVEIPYLKSRNVTLINMNLTQCNNLTYNSDEYWKCYLKVYSMTSFHPVGTNRMGKVDDPEAVVDSRLRVIGVKGKKRLRVVDASVVPQVPRCNTMCTAYNVGWNAAKMIIEDNMEDGGDKNAGTKVVVSWVLGLIAVLTKVLF